MTAEQRRAALGFLGLAAVLAVVGWLVPDPRLRALAWIAAIPLAAAGALPIAWGNATTELSRLRSRRE